MSFSASIVELVEGSASGLVGIAPWWKRVALGDVASILNGYPWKSVYFNDHSGTPLIRIRDVTSGRTETRFRGHVEDGYWIENGDLLVGMDGDFSTRVWNGGRALLNQRVCRISTEQGFYLKGFLAKVLPGYLQLINQETHSVTVKHLSSNTLAELPLPLPPLSEQKRIVAKIDSLSAESGRARNHLDHLPRLVEKYKQAVLAAAFRGELTREWRKGASTGAWVSSTIGEVATIASGQTPKGIETVLTADGEVPWFKVSSMNEPGNLDGLRSSQFRLSRQQAHRLGLRLVSPGSITFPKRGGAIATNKKRRVLVEGALDLNLMVLTARAVTPNFLWWWMQELDLASISNGSNVPQINNGDIAPLKIEVPPPAEQDEISRKVAEAFAWIDRLASEARNARTLVDHLDQAVLAKAFRGELVPQDSSDEHASVLLERIRAERVTTRRSASARGRSSRSVEDDNPV
jgi:type I restriction enzyme, S subunit